jgi:hypothetical protein
MSELAPDDQSRDARRARLTDLILSGGHDIKIHTAKGQRPAYAHTIGLTLNGQPELVVFGLAPHQACRVLEDFCSRLDRRPLRPGFYEDGFIGQTVALIAISQGRARGFIQLPTPLFTQDQLTSAQQVVWPDPAGQFPWQPYCEISARVQPLLGSPPPTEPSQICGGVIND